MISREKNQLNVLKVEKRRLLKNILEKQKNFLKEFEERQQWRFAEKKYKIEF